MKYGEQYKDPRWQKKRLEILERDRWSCAKCGMAENTLHVHHRYYIKGADPWDYPNEVLITLCEDCHKNESECFWYDFQIIKEQVAIWCFSTDIVPLFEVLCSWQKKGNYPTEVIIDALRHFFVLGDGLETVMKLYWDILKKKLLIRERDAANTIHKA